MNTPVRGRPQRFSSDDAEGSMAVAGRNLIFSGDVSNKFVAFLSENLALRRGAQKNVRLVLSSPGGDVYSMNAALDLLAAYGGVSTVATGCCMSAAVPIVACGKKGERFATPSTRFMLHAGWIEIDRPMTLAYMDAEKRELALLESGYIEVLAHATGTHNISWWRKRAGSEVCWYFSAEEALELGIIDKILDDQILLSRVPKKARRKRRK